jgi:hypothetical protein
MTKNPTISSVANLQYHAELFSDDIAANVCLTLWYVSVQCICRGVLAG